MGKAPFAETVSVFSPSSIAPRKKEEKRAHFCGNGWYCREQGIDDIITAKETRSYRYATKHS